MGTVTHVALLRGINVGGKNRLDMKSLAAAFETAGARAVRTYIQSGNVVFEAPAQKAPALARAVVAALRERGLTVPIVLRTAAALGAAIAANPFRARHGDGDAKAWHVCFLADRPTPERAAALDPKRSPPDELRLVGQELFLRCPAGFGQSKLTSAYLDRALDTVGTVRNWATVLALGQLTGLEA